MLHSIARADKTLFLFVVLVFSSNLLVHPVHLFKGIWVNLSDVLLLTRLRFSLGDDHAVKWSREGVKQEGGEEKVC